MRETTHDVGIACSSPAGEWERKAARRALDELFSHARLYKDSKSYRELLNFVTRFRFYSPFNAMLIHTQMEGANFVAPAHRWERDYRRHIKPGSRPIVILQPMGPVMFVFDVAQTEPEANAPPLPREVEQPFEVRRGRVGNELRMTIENALRDGVLITEHEAGSQRAGSIQIAPNGQYLHYQTKSRPQPSFIKVPLRYQLLLNSNLSREARYATLTHELAHLYWAMLARRIVGGGLTDANCHFTFKSSRLSRSAFLSANALG